MNRDRLMQRIYDLALAGSIPAARLFLRETESGETEQLSTGQILALVRDELRSADLSQKISPAPPPSNNHQNTPIRRLD